MGATYNPGVNQSDISSSIESTNDAKQRQRDFINALSGLGGGPASQSALGSLNQLQDQAQGNGPNPALAQLALTTGQNVKNQAALLAGQRGVGANPGLAARQIGQLGGDFQQQAVGQGAALRAQQQIAAQQQLQQQQSLLLALQQQGISNLGNTSLGQTGQYLSAFGQAGQTEAKNNPVNQILGGVTGALGTVGAAALKGGTGLSNGGPVSGNAAGAVGTGSATLAPMGAIPMYETGGKVGGTAKVEGDHPKNDTVPAMLSPGEVVIPRSHVKDPKKVAAFINSTLGMNLKVGKKSS